MSEDDIDKLLSNIVDFLEYLELGEWLNDDRQFEDFQQLLYDWGDPYYTKERNYN
jgi:hypothetical protein